MSFWDIWLTLSPQAQVEIIIGLLVWFLASTMPFLGLTIKLKKRVKVARIDIYAFLFWYFIILVLSYFSINAVYDAALLFAYLSGPLIGVALMFIIFNKISEGIKKAWIIILKIEEVDTEVNLCYIYDYAGERALIRLNSEGHEEFGAMWNRFYHNTHIFLKSEGAHFEFTEHKVNVAIFCTEWDWYEEEMEVDGKLKICKVLYVAPISATQYSLMAFLTKFKDFKQYVRKIAALTQENISLRSKIYLLAGKMFKKWVVKTEKAYYGEEAETTDDLIEEFNKEFDKLEGTNRILPVPEEEKGEGETKEEAEEDEEAEEPKTEEETEGEEAESE